MDAEAENIGMKPIARTDVPGLDDVLIGGLTPENLFLLEGEPGTGKTTIALRFLLTGAEAGEPGLYVTLSESGRGAFQCSRASSRQNIARSSSVGR